MAESTGDTVKSIKVSMPKPGQVSVINVEPGEEINLENIDLENADVDIVGDDVVIADPETGARLVFSGMALLMFDESVAPSIFLNGGSVPLAPQALLGRVGEVGNLSVKDFIAVSSLMPEGDGEQRMLGESEKGSDGDENAANTETSEAEMVFTSVMQAQAQRQTEFESNKEADFSKQLTSSKPITAVDEKGEIEKAPLKTSTSSSSSTSSTPDDLVSPDPDTAPPEPPPIAK